MNTTFSIRINNELKNTFLANTKKKGLDGASIIRHFMEKFNSNPDIVKLDIDFDFKELEKSDLTDEILNSIKKAKNTPKSKLINLSREYANY